jgi:hypothetical protein
VKRIFILVLAQSLLAISCKNEDINVKSLAQYNQRAYGSLPFGAVRAIVVRNSLGGVFIEGSSDTAQIGWFLDKWVTAESQSAAGQVFSQLQVSMQLVNDTAYVDVNSPSGLTGCNASLSLSVPAQTPAILREVVSACSVSYLQSSFTGENVAATTILGHNGDCLLNGSNGKATVAMSLRENGFCNIRFVSGAIELKIPAATSSMLFAQTGTGTIHHSGLIVTDTSRTAHSFSGKLGSGRATIQLSTGAGNISITGF